MALVSEIIKDAFREANLIPINQEPSLAEQTEGLRLLNRFVRSVFGNEAGDKLRTYAIGEAGVITPASLESYDFTASKYVPLNARLLANLSESQVLNLHPDPEDGSRVAVIDAAGNFGTTGLTLTGNGRLIDGATTVLLTTPSVKSEWFYRADLASWMIVTDLVQDTTFPFPMEFEDMFVIGLALRLNPRNGVSADEQTMLTFRRTRNIFRSRYTQVIEQPSEEGLTRLTGIRVNRQIDSTT
jgi:hypothetical protein